MERVWNWVLAVEAPGEARVLGGVVDDGGLAASAATQPAMPSPIFTRKTETSLPFSPRASSKVSSCFSSSTISMDQASEGMSCWILAMISSMTLRGSRMEFAVFTMSVRMARRWVIFFSCWPGPVPSRAAAPGQHRAHRRARPGRGAGASTGDRAGPARHPRPQSATSTGRRCSFTPPLMPTGRHHHELPARLCERDELVEGAVGLHVHALAVHGHGRPGLGAALDLQDVRAHVEGLDDERRRRPVARRGAALGRATVKRAKSEKSPSTPSLSTAATRQ